MNVNQILAIARLLPGHRIAALTLLALLPALAGAAGDGTLRVSAECSNGVAHGAYRVESAQGKLRIEGHYANGLREGDFVFYTAGGEKMIVLPYARGLLHGTVTAWHVGDGSDTSQSTPKLVSDIRAGFIQGRHQTWYENGQPRSDFVIEDGEITTGKAWNPDGTDLEINDAGLFLNAEIENDFNYYNRLEQVMDAYPPDC